MERIATNNPLDRIYELAKGSSPFGLDRSHSFSVHAVPVANNCRRIAGVYCAGQVDLDVVYAAGLVHDLSRDENGHGGHGKAKQILQRSGASEEFTKKVLLAINSHSDLTVGKTLEEQVLWLADKLEYFSIDRLEATLKGLPNILFKIVFKRYADHWRSRVGPILEEVKRLDELNFPGIAKEFSDKVSNLRDHFQQKRPQFLKLLEETKL